MYRYKNQKYVNIILIQIHWSLNENRDALNKWHNHLIQTYLNDSI